VKEWKLEPARDLGLSMAERARSLRRELGWFGCGILALRCLLYRAYFRLWHRMEVRGEKNLPREPPFLIVANHESHLDGPALSIPLGFRHLGSTFAIGADDVFFDHDAKAVFFAFFAGAVPIRRNQPGRRAIDSMRERLLSEGAVYVLFPEGTRTRDGRMLPFKTGLGRLVAGTGVPVVPCHLSGTFRALPPGAHLPRGRKIRLRIGPPMRFDSLSDDRHGWREATRRCEEAVRTLSELPRSRSAGPRS